MDNRRNSSYTYNSSNPHTWIAPGQTGLPAHTIQRRGSDAYNHNHLPRLNQSQAQPLQQSMNHANYNSTYAYDHHKPTSPPSYYPGAQTATPVTPARQAYTSYAPPTYSTPSNHVHNPPYLPQLPHYMSQRQAEEIQYPASPPRPFSCDMCPLSFNRQHDLKRHRETHSGDKPFLCEECGKSFTRKDALKRHQTVKKCGNLKAG